MTVHEWAKRLNGIECPAGRLDDLSRDMREDGVIAAYRNSDDMLEFRGVIDDEVGTWQGDARIGSTEEGGAFLFDVNKNRNTAEFNRKEINSMSKITALWAPPGKNGKPFSSWIIKTDIPHKTFDIMKDGGLFCRGVIFHVNDVGKV